MAEKCTCGCCGPDDQDTESRATWEREREEAARRIEELERRVQELERAPA